MLACLFSSQNPSVPHEVPEEARFSGSAKTDHTTALPQPVAGSGPPQGGDGCGPSLQVQTHTGGRGPDGVKAKAWDGLDSPLGTYSREVTFLPIWGSFLQAALPSQTGRGKGPREEGDRNSLRR